VSVSRGALDPQSTASELEAAINTPFVAALRSTHEQHGGMRWTRSVIRRRDGYTVILDQLTAHEADTYGMTCRWRSYHQGSMRHTNQFEAVDGQRAVRFRIVSATPVTWQVETEKRDGAARPTMVRQSRREQLAAGESVTFQNLLYASDPEHPRPLAVEELGENAVLVRGRVDDGAELAAIGTGPMALPGCSLDAGLWYLSRTGVALAGVRRVAFGDRLELSAEQRFDVTLDGTDGRGWIEIASKQSVPLRVSGKLTIDGTAAAGTLDLTPGRHPIEVSQYKDLLARIEQGLSTRPQRAEPVASITAPPVALIGGATFAPLWEHQGELPPLAEHGSVKVWGEPEPDIGSAETWTNRLIGPPPGYGWHGSERGGWTAGKQGAILMDLGEPVDIADIELIRSRRYRTETGAFNPGEFEFDVVLSNDEFQKDLRKLTVKDARYGVLRVENAHYTHTRRFPQITVPIGKRARYVRLTPRRVKEIKSPPASYYGTYRDDEISFMELTVHRADREPRRHARLLSSGSGNPLLIEAGTRLTALDAKGKVRWEQRLDAIAAAPSQVVDVDDDGTPEALVFTLAETLSIFDITNGERKLLFDLDAQPNTPNVADLTHSSLRPNMFTVWRPDPKRPVEVAFFPHYDYGRIILGDEPRYQKITYPNTMRSAKYAFQVPDVTGDGQPELGLVGIYGLQFGVMPSDAPLDDGVFGKYVMGARMTGYNSGNMELQLYWGGGVVRNAAGEWLGMVAINPGGLDYCTHPGFKPAWSHFH
ncbi:MAG: hypothetical protein HN904_19700, partial [Victivallales bacterium]|nr:hypothetical protein [Victivallales bacterium]